MGIGKIRNSSYLMGKLGETAIYRGSSKWEETLRGVTGNWGQQLPQEQRILKSALHFIVMVAPASLNDLWVEC